MSSRNVICVAASLLVLLGACSVDNRNLRTARGASSGLGGETQQVEPAGGSAEAAADAPAAAAEPPASPPGAPGEGDDGTSSAGEGESPSSMEMSAASTRLTVSWVGDGEGSVSISVPGKEPYQCPVGCGVPAPAGSLVTVTANPQPYSVVRGWSEPSCGTQLSCTLMVQADTSLSLEFQLEYQVAFITATTYLPSQLPRPGETANAECTRIAKAAGFHGSRWAAWLSSSNGTPETSDDLHAVEQLQHTGGWLRPDGVPVARSVSALVRGEVLAPILLSRRNATAPFAAWSSTAKDGRLQAPAGALDCNGWASDDGALQASVIWGVGIGAHWDGVFVQGCNEPQGMLCLGDDSDEEVLLSPLAGRLVFLSESSFTPGGGVPAADALCQREACEAGLTGGSDCAQAPGSERTFLSYLHTSNRRAWERFDLSGLTWVRPDGMKWLSAAADLARDAADALVPPGVSLGPRYGIGPGAMWVGEAAGTSNCNDWTASSGAGATYAYDSQEETGLGNLLLPGGYVSVFDCSQPFPVLCLEQ